MAVVDEHKIKLAMERIVGVGNEELNDYLLCTSAVYFEDEDNLGVAGFEILEAKLNEVHYKAHEYPQIMSGPGYCVRQCNYLLSGYKDYMHIIAVAELWDGGELLRNGVVGYLKSQGPPSEVEAIKQVYWDLLRKLDWISSGDDIWVHSARLIQIICQAREREIKNERSRNRKRAEDLNIKPIRDEGKATIVI